MHGVDNVFDEIFFRAECITPAYLPMLTAFVFPQVCATLGTTGVCAFDCLSELGPICKCLPRLARKTSDEF